MPVETVPVEHGAPIAPSEDTTTTDLAPKPGAVSAVSSRLKKVAKWIYNIVSSHLGLTIILFIYSFVGAAIFNRVEGPVEDKRRAQVLEFHNDTIQKILNETWHAFAENGLDKDDFNLTERLSEVLRTHAGVYGGGVDEKVWDYWGSMFFCFTVYTTIGYGHIAPVTAGGRILFMVYALIGIPLCLVAMASLGRLLTRAIKFLWRFVRRLYYTGHCRRIRRTMPQQAVAMRKSFESKLDVRSRQLSKEDTSCLGRALALWRRCWTRCWHCCWDAITCRRGNPKHNSINTEDEEHNVEHNGGVAPDDDAGSYVSIVDENVDEFNVPPAVAIFVTILYIFLGAIMYMIWESWSFLEAFYFIFVSVSTIGFGDVLPAHPKFFMASSIYILTGLALLAMVITVIMVVVMDTISRARDTMVKAADHIDKAADMAKGAVMDVGQKMGISMSSQSLDKMDEPEEKDAAETGDKKRKASSKDVV